MVNQHPAKSDEQSHCGSANIIFVMVEEEDST